MTRVGLPRWMVVVAGVVLMAAIVAYLLATDRPLDRPCPDAGVRSITPEEVHLAPSLLQHQSWIGFPATQLPNTDAHLYACTDGLAIGEKIDQFEVDPASGLIQVKIPTRWVNLIWLSGDLEAYGDPGRWRVVIASR